MKYLLFILLISQLTMASASQIESGTFQDTINNLEKTFDGKIGVYAINTKNNQILSYRAEERFPVQSTLKLIGVSALLKASNKDKNLLNEKIQYTKDDLMEWHPITGLHVTNGMTLQALSEAAISYSDNPAMNLIMKKMGGPKFVTDFAHSIGNQSFNADRYEGELNSNTAYERDTSTPKDMAISLKNITLGNVLTPSQRTQLISWMKDNTTGYKRMRRGAPIGWVVAEKTGSGDYGVANDIGILWSPLCKPIVLAIYTVQNKHDATRRDDILASATTMVLEEFAKSDSCFKALFS